MLLYRSFVGVLLASVLAGLAAATSIPLTGAGAGGCLPTTSTWTKVLGSNSAGIGANASSRNVHASLSIGGTRLRYQIASGTGGFDVTTASVCIRSANDACTATPVQVFFSGSASVSIGASSLQYTDPVVFSFASTDTLLTIIDNGANGSYKFTASGDGDYFKTSTTSYNVQSPAGFTSDPSSSIEVTNIEACGP